MSVDNIIDGRNRAIEVLNILNPAEGAEVLYGNYSYLSFIFKHNSLRIGATVRTSKDKYIKMDSGMLEGNQMMCEELGVEHNLFLGFQWNGNREIFRIEDSAIEDCLSHCTKVKNYRVFRLEGMSDVDGISRIL